jgi:AcrR family transcriptional regulator
MKQFPAVTVAGHAGTTAAGGRAKRLAGTNRREQVLQTASTQFAMTGLHGTTTLALANAAGVSEPILYVHFGSKERLFREAVERNIETRLGALDARLSSIHRESSIVKYLEGMAEAKVSVCLSDAGNAVLTNWALLEAPEYAANLYRNEIGAVGILWERELARRCPESRSQAVLSAHIRGR